MLERVAEALENDTDRKESISHGLSYSVLHCVKAFTLTGIFLPHFTAAAEQFTN